MAKKKANKKATNIAKSSNKVITLPIVDQYGLFQYKHYADAPNNSYRVFFEEPKSADEVDKTNKEKNFLYAGRFSRTQKGCEFWLVESGRELVGDEIAKRFAQLLTKKIIASSLAKSSVSTFLAPIKCFFKHLASQPSPPKTFSELNVGHFSQWCDSLPSKRAQRSLSVMKLLLDETHLIKLRSLRVRTNDTSNSAPLKEQDFDALVQPSDYSDAELMQILAYAFYDIESSQKQFKLLQNVSVEWLGENYLPLDEMKSGSPTLVRLFTSGAHGHYLLMANMTLLLKHQENEVRVASSSTNATTFAKRLKEANKASAWKDINPYKGYMAFLQQQYWPSSAEGLLGNRITTVHKWFTLQTVHHEFAILIYFLITTGANLETALSLQWAVNGKPWCQNFDVKMGIKKDTSPRDQSVLLIGGKRKGQKAKRGFKPIEIPISVSSPLYGYLKFLDKTRPAGREFIFNLKQVNQLSAGFCAFYPLFSDNGENLSSLQTPRFRKVFAGHELLKILKDVKNADELTSRLKVALHHDQFDTTFFSYLMKSGLSNLAMNSAIVALTTDMLEKAMTFRGQIKQDGERSGDARRVFLCDCSDPCKPEHNLPVAGRCKTYDLCLGCERSEVYAEHLPAICYRIMQYEQKRKADPNVFKAAQEDRLHIALDTLKQFKVRHSNGMELVDQAYIKANQALEDNTPLLPPILQTGVISCTSLT